MHRSNALFGLITVLGFLGCSQSDSIAASNDPIRAAATSESSSSGASPPSLAAMLVRVSPAVVNISVRGTRRAIENPLFADPLFRRFFGLPEDSTPQGAPVERFQAAGSGVIFDANRGYIVTNNHVVEHADRIQVTLTDRRQFDAKLIGSDGQSDVAVLKISTDRLTSLPLGASKDLRVGDYVVAIGNPFGVGQAATFGIVSAVGRTGLGIESYEDFIQTDASINPGNSGGALVDVDGRLVGVNAAIISRGGGNVGVGFAIPADMVKSIAQQLIASGKVSRGSLGLTIQDLTPSLAQAMGVAPGSGALVAQVMPQSAAAKAGILDGDIITKLNSEAVSGAAQLRNAVGRLQPGAAVSLTLLRDGRERAVTATLDQQDVASAAPLSRESQEKTPLSGMMFGPIPRDDPRFGRLEGVYVTDVDPESAAAEAGIRKGDIIVSANRIAVKTPSDLARMLQSPRNKGPLLVQIRRGDAALFVALG